MISRAGYRAGSGEPVVLLHGFTATWSSWRPVLADLAARYDVYAPTLHGHAGGPAWPADTPPAHDTATRLIEELLDEQGIETAHLVGNSMGGALALDLAKRGRARSVVAIAPGGGWHHGTPEGPRLVKLFTRMQRMAKATSRQAPVLLRRPGSRRLGLRDVMCRGELVHVDDAVQMQRDSIACSVVPQVFSMLQDGRATVRDLDQVTAPTLVAWPEQDRTLPMDRYSARFRDEIPGVTFRVLRGCGHVPMWDDPRLVTDTIVGWVDQHAGDRVTA